jgi:hypothetical protein
MGVGSVALYVEVDSCTGILNESKAEFGRIKRDCAAGARWDTSAETPQTSAFEFALLS